MQEVFKRIIERIYESGVCSGNEESGFILLNKARQIVEQAAEGYNNGWISCSVRLPESKKGVLVNYKNGDFAVDFMHEDGKWFWEDEEEGLVVIAWQPLPQTYKPKED